MVKSDCGVSTEVTVHYFQSALTNETENKLYIQW